MLQLSKLAFPLANSFAHSVALNHPLLLSVFKIFFTSDSMLVANIANSDTFDNIMFDMVIK